jgi:hypothetical protein
MSSIVLASVVLLVIAAALALTLIVVVRGALTGFRQALGEHAQIRQRGLARSAGD